MQLKFWESFLLIFVLFALPSCDKEEDNDGNGGGGSPCSTSWSTSLINEINAINTAVMMYGIDPSTSNCNAVKSAYQNYIDGLQSFGNCSGLTGQDRDAYEQTYQEAQDALSTWQC